MSGTIICRRLLKAFGPAITLRIGSTMSLTSGALFLAAAGFGLAHWMLVTLAIFTTMLAHGVNFPVSQSGSVTPFPQQAGTAAGLMGALYMSVAFAVGTAVGASYNGTVYPLAIIACTLGAAIFASVRLVGAGRVKAAA
jgi:DHA1 family bicyclomycin/chloramphenicol resistance-like MFS transporter